MIKATVVVSALLAISGIPGRAEVITGEPSLQGYPAQTEGFLKATATPGNPLDEHLDVWMTLPKSPVAIKRYQIEMTKKLHMVIVSDDFKTFLHIHPTLSPAGHFLITQQFPAPGTYYVYADALPNDLNHQVFRFKLDVGHPSQPSARNLPTTGMGVQVGPYEVDLSTVRIHAGRMEMVDVEVLENGKPAKDLHPYLGAPAHAVFLNAKDLSYVHVHPMGADMMNMQMDMSKPMPELPDNASVSGEMMLHIALREAGTYKLWLQFRGASDKLYVAGRGRRHEDYPKIVPDDVTDRCGAVRCSPVCLGPCKAYGDGAGRRLDRRLSSNCIGYILRGR
jgi:hypothetical protein